MMTRKWIILLATVGLCSLGHAEDTCQKIEDQLNEIEQKQSEFSLPEQNNVGKLTQEIAQLDRGLVMVTAIHQHQNTAANFSVEEFVSTYFKGIDDPLNNHEIKNILSELSQDCSALSSSEELSKCSSAIGKFQTEAEYQSAQVRIDKFKQQKIERLNSTYNDPKFKNLSHLAQFLAAKKLKECPEENSHQACSTGQTHLDELGSNTMDILQKYYVDQASSENPGLEETCKKLAKANYQLKACNGVVCPKGQDLVVDQCLRSCTKLEYRQSKSPYACIPDEAAQQKQNLRKQENKQKWGKVARTAAIVAVAGGVAAGLIWIASEAFKGEFSDTTNYNISTGPNYNNYNVTKDYTTCFGPQIRLPVVNC